MITNDSKVFSKQRPHKPISIHPPLPLKEVTVPTPRKPFARECETILPSLPQADPTTPTLLHQTCKLGLLGDLQKVCWVPKETLRQS